MKRNILLSIIFILTVVSFASCSFETDTIDGDGKIEGFWHMERIDTLVSDSAGVTTVVATKDLSRELLFWSFQHKLLELSDKNLVYTNVLCRFTTEGGQLKIGDTFTSGYGTDSPNSDPALLLPYGMSKMNETFSYNVDGSKMTLTDKNIRIHLKRF